MCAPVWFSVCLSTFSRLIPVAPEIRPVPHTYLMASWHWVCVCVWAPRGLKMDCMYHVLVDRSEQKGICLFERMLWAGKKRGNKLSETNSRLETSLSLWLVNANPGAFNRSSAESPGRLSCLFFFAFDFPPRTRWPNTTLGHRLYVHGCCGNSCPSQGGTSGADVWEIPTSCPACKHTHTHTHSTLHTAKHTHTLSLSLFSVSVSLSLGRPLPWQAAVTLLWLFMSNLSHRPANFYST